MFKLPIPTRLTDYLGEAVVWIVIINWMKIGFSQNEYSEGVKMHGLTKNFGKFLFFDQKL